MRVRGILVRDRSRDVGCEGCVRITIGTFQQTKQLLATLAEVFSSLELLKPELSR